MPIPPDTRVPGDDHHVDDHNAIADELTALVAADATETSRAQAAEALLAPKASPALTGTPTAPTPGGADSSTKLATTAFVAAAVPPSLPPNGPAGGALTGTYPNPGLATVTIPEGGTGQATQQAALDALAGAQTSGQVLRGNGTHVQMAAIQAADVPTLNQSTTGTAAGLSATLAITSGGTGQTARQAALDALTGTQTAGTYARSDGTHTTLSAIQAADVPTLNQSTTGTAKAPDVQLFTSGGTWTKPAGAQAVFASVCGSGGGAGSGASGASGSVLCGGGGGGAPILSQRQFKASDLTSTVSVTVGAAPNGGASVTGAAGTTNGNAGTGGNQSSFGTYLKSAGGLAGQGGTNTTGTGGINQFNLNATAMGQGASASTTGAAGIGINPALLGPAAGPSGGGITSGATAGNGAAGNTSFLGGDAVAGTAGVVGGASPGQGTVSATTGAPGPSGGSGAASTTGAAQAGADALANTGAGGAGGGAALNGSASGAGGKGGSGFVLVISLFQ